MANGSISGIDSKVMSKGVIASSKKSQGHCGTNNPAGQMANPHLTKKWPGEQVTAHNDSETNLFN